MVDFQTLTLLSLTLLTAAMFIFYYLVFRRTPPGTRKRSQTAVKHRSPNMQINTAQLDQVRNQNQAPVQKKVPFEEPVLRQTVPQSTPQISFQAPPPENFAAAATPILRGEAAAEALKEFVEELEERRGKSAHNTRDASLIKLARVLMDATQADEEYKEPSMQPDQTKNKVERENETAKKRKETVTKPPHKRRHHRKKKNTKKHRPSRAAGRKAQKRKAQPKVKKKPHRGQMKKRSHHFIRANVRGKRGKKVRPARRK